ncbi:hypothetical protein BDDG_09601 [Blastomyces dermatitidis ATCC 18188]|uniref:Uncharacterized protein n=1 Tax=Ajellomyces dermatitidis (strain ATCC 18188 / CBS 674.68) TaxID=653446 RepID=F2TTU1_AJEDA|nr:hypothetical protein BDDG_09601 [Blastomyces dermatitidis ATCC 18188]
MTSYSHNKHHCNTHTEQFVSKQCITMNNDTSSSPSHTSLIISLLKSSHVDRSAFTDDSEPDVAFLIENLKNMIMKKLSVSCVAGSSVSSLAPSAASSSAAPLSVPSSATPQSSTLAPVSGSPAPATSVPVIPTSATSGFTASAFVTSSPHFKEMLCRLNEPCLSRITSLLNSIEIVKEIVMSFTVHEVIAFTDIKKLFITVKFNITETFTLMNFFRMIDLYQPIL